MDAALLARLDAIEAPAGECLLAQGEDQPWLVYLLEGVVEARIPGEDGPVTVGRVEAPALIGEIGFVDGGEATASMVAVTPILARRLHRDALAAMLVEAPDVAGRLLREVNRALAARLAEASAGELEAVDDHTYEIRRADRGARVRRALERLWRAR